MFYMCVLLRQVVVARRSSARCILITESKSGSGARPSRAARSARNRAGQLVTILATAGSGTQSTSALTAGPATRSSAATMSATVTVSGGRLTALRPPQAPSDDVAAPLNPNSGAQNQSYNVLVIGSQTHFLQGT